MKTISHLKNSLQIASRFSVLIFILIFSTQGMAQTPWSPVHRDKLYSYKKIEFIAPNYICNQLAQAQLQDFNPIVQNIRIERDSILGTDTLLILNRRAKPIGYTGQINSAPYGTIYVWDFQHPSFLNSEIRITTLGEYYFQGLDTFLLKPQAGLGEFWTYKDTISATVIDLQADTLWNTPDSVKTILLSNNDTIRLSRNFGILKFPDPDSLGLYCTLLGLQRDTATWGQRTPDFWDAYNLNVGDVLMYEGGEGAYEGDYGTHYAKISITQKNTLPTGYAYAYTRITVGICYSSPVYYGPYPCFNVCYTPFTNDGSSTNITLLKDSCHLVNDFYPDELSYMHSIDSFMPSYSRPLMTFASLSSNDSIIKYNIYMESYFQTDSTFYDQFIGIYKFKPALGFVFYDYSGFETARWSHLIGYVKNGDTVGTIYSDPYLIALSTKPIESQNTQTDFASLSPNPAPNGHAQLLFKETLSEGVGLKIYNSTGQRVAGRQARGNELSIELDYPELPKGLYFIRLNSGGKEQVLKWVIF